MLEVGGRIFLSETAQKSLEPTETPLVPYQPLVANVELQHWTMHSVWLYAWIFAVAQIANTQDLKKTSPKGPFLPNSHNLNHPVLRRIVRALWSV